MQSPILIALVLAAFTAVVRSDFYSSRAGYQKSKGSYRPIPVPDYQRQTTQLPEYSNKRADMSRGYRPRKSQNSYRPKTTAPVTQLQTTQPPAVYGHWGPWSTCSSCSVSCGTGSCTRTRACDSSAPSSGGPFCPGRDSDTQACFQNPQQVDGDWSAWLTFGQCSKSCGDGVQHRVRFCSSPAPLCGGHFCPGSAFDSVHCTYGPCPVDGVWGPWSECTACSASCGTGSCLRQRLCNNPAPVNGGRECEGHDQLTEKCAVALQPEDGGWSAWQTMGQCNVTCGSGVQLRVRTCTNPVPQCGGASCPGDAVNVLPCNAGLCPVDGSWGHWSSCSVCSVSCGSGSCIRVRNCDSPAPSNGGKLCVGPEELTESCSVQPMPEDGVVSEWSQWNDCSTLCDAGQQTRRRSCDVLPVCGGTPCVGPFIVTRPCNEQSCTPAPQTSTPIPATCRGRCGDHDVNKPCQCDKNCKNYKRKDCCSDYKTLCPSKAKGSRYSYNYNDYNEGDDYKDYAEW